MAIKVTIMPLDIDPESKPVMQILDKEEITIGRLPSNDIVLNRPEISGIHARVRLEPSVSGEPSKLYITDLGSANGTMVEKNPLRARVEVAMLPNERIFIGNYVIKPALEEDVISEQENLDDMMSENDSAEVRRNYLSEALKEYELGKKSVGSSKEIEDRIDRFAEERAVANGVSPSSSFLNTIMEDSSKRARVNTESASLSLNAMFGSEQRAPEPLAPFGGGVFRKVEDNIPQSSDYAQKSAVDSFRVPVPSNEPEVEKVSSSFRVNASDSNAAVSKDVDVTEIKNPIARAFTAKKSPALSPADVTDALQIKVRVDGSDVNAFNFSAAAYTNIAGRVTHKGGPLAGVKVTAGSLGEIMTDENGVFEFPKVLEGTSYLITLDKDKFIFEPKEFRGSTTITAKGLNTEATELFSISGIINHNGQPLAGVVVDGGVLGKVTTSSDGSYRFDNVPEGQEYNLTLSKEGYAFVK